MNKILILFVLVVLVSVISVNDVFADLPQFLFEFGSEGIGPGQFRSPEGIAIDASKNIYVSDVEGTNDAGGNGIQKFDPNGNFLSKFYTYGTATEGGPDNGQLKAAKEGSYFDTLYISPRHITFDNVGNLYVSENNINIIQKFDPDGNFLLKFWNNGTDFSGGSSGAVAMKADLSGNLYVVSSDFRNSILKFDSNGNFLQKFDDGANGEYISIAIDENNNILVGDYYYKKISKFDSNGNFLFKFGSNGTGDGQFLYPNLIDVDKNGEIYVVDDHRGDIQKFDSNGNFLLKIAKCNTGIDTRRIDAMVIDSGKLYLVDRISSKVQVFDITLQTTPITPDPCAIRETFGLLNLRLTDLYDNKVTTIIPGQELLIQADVYNDSDDEIPFVYVIKITESTGHNFLLSHLPYMRLDSNGELGFTGSLSAGQYYTHSKQWSPIQSGTYIAEISFYDSYENRNKLAPSITTQIVVGNGIFVESDLPFEPDPLEVKKITIMQIIEEIKRLQALLATLLE